MTDNRHMPHTTKPYLWRLGRGTSENLTWEAIKKTWGSSPQTDPPPPPRYVHVQLCKHTAHCSNTACISAAFSDCSLQGLLTRKCRGREGERDKDKSCKNI